MTGNNNTNIKSNKRNYEEYYNVDKEDLQRKKQKILKDKHKFPLLIRRKIDKLIVSTFVTEDDNFNATAFIQGVCNAIHILLCHVGLNINRESMNEVEFAIRLFPRVLSMKWQQDDDYNSNSSAGYYPISLQTTQNGYRNCRECLPHGGVFLPLLIRLAIEFGIFKKQLRGGLLINDPSGNTVLQSLVMSSNSNDEKFSTINHLTIVDDSFLDALVKLKEMGCIKKEDICDHNLLINICGSRNGNFFSFKRFQFLVECNPYALAHGTKLHNYLPLHFAANKIDMHIFRAVLQAGIQYLPMKAQGINLLFRKDYRNETPFYDACKRYGYEETMKVIEKTLIDCSCYNEYDNSTSNSCTSNTTLVALFLAATDKNIHLDGVYFLLQSDPDLAEKLLSMMINSSTTTTITTSSIDNDNDKDDNNDAGGGSMMN
jgi:hypothetical protein